MTVAGRYVKNPVGVEAVQWERLDQAAVIVAWCDEATYVEQAIVQSFLDETGRLVPAHIVLGTLHGPTEVQLGEWIVRGPGGDYWPNTAEEFARNYITELEYAERVG